MELVKISTANYGGKVHYGLNKECIKKLLVNPEVKNMKVAVVSVFGKGSTVIFDLLVKYAIHRYKEQKSEHEEWLAEGIEPQEEYIKQPAKTFMVWPEVFTATTKSGENIGVLLMGTQGILALQEEAGTFAINILTSSCQIFHVMRRISEEQMKQIEMFTEFAKHLIDMQAEGKPFQKLSFVVRGWDTPTQYDFCTEGGHRYMIESIFHDARLVPERLKTRQNIISSFDEITCFLMTDTREGTMRAREKEMRTLFTAHAKTFVADILAPDKLIMKRIDGQLTTVGGLLEVLTACVGELNRSKLPDVKTMYRPTLQANYLVVKKAAMKLYMSRMIELGCADQSYVDPGKLAMWHEEAKVIALDYFDDRYEYDASISDHYKNLLMRAIEEQYAIIRAQNDSKYENFESLVWMPIFSAALITFAILIFKFHSKEKPISAKLNWSALFLFWLGVTIFFRWCYLLYLAALRVLGNSILQLIIWTSAGIYAATRIYLFLRPKPRRAKK